MVCECWGCQFNSLSVQLFFIGLDMIGWDWIFKYIFRTSVRLIPTHLEIQGRINLTSVKMCLEVLQNTYSAARQVIWVNGCLPCLQLVRGSSWPLFLLRSSLRRFRRHGRCSDYSMCSHSFACREMFRESEDGDSVWEIKNVRCGTIADIRISTPDLIVVDLWVSVDATKRHIQ
jgi:hypothetical protein